MMGLKAPSLTGGGTVNGSLTVSGNNGAGVLFLLGGAGQLANTGNIAGSLTMNGFYIPVVLTRLTTPVDVVSSTTETTLFTYTVPANVMGTTRRLRLELGGDYLNNSGLILTTSETVRIKFGGTTIWEDTGKLHANSSNRKPWFMRINVTNLGATNLQGLGGTILLGGSPSTTGIGEYSDDEVDASTAIGNTGIAIDTTATAVLAVTVQHGQADANISYRVNSGTLELV
jgi:hypothetical protein